MPYADREKQLAYLREYSIRRNRAKGRAPHGSPEHRERVSAAIAKAWETRERVDQSGEKNPSWKGDGAGWNAIHWWLRRNYPKEAVCSECGQEGRTDYAFLRHPEPYTRDRNDYRELCRRCHLKFDGSKP